MKGFANVFGVDDGPFARRHRGDVALCGVAYARERLTGVVYGKLRKDGANATEAIARLVGASRVAEHARCVRLGGVTFGGFNVVDAPALADALSRPVLVVMRRRPNLREMHRALADDVPGGTAKRRRLERAGPIERCGAVYVQRHGLSFARAEATLALHTRDGHLPESLRVAHLLAAAHVRGHSHGRA